MKNKKTIVNTVFNSVKFATLALFCVFFVLIANHFCRVKDYAESLSRYLNITVFFDNNAKENGSVKEDLENTGFVSVKEYVNTSEAYSKAIERNPFLKDVSVPGDVKSIEAYAVVTPKSMPDENFLLEMRNSLEQVSNVDEVVFDISVFKQYVEVKKTLLLYHKIFFIFAVSVFVLFVLKCVFFVTREELNDKKLVKKFVAYTFASALGFLAMWSVCVFVQYPLSINDASILCIIPFTAVLGVVLDRTC
jgi:cell division transport system permease protein